MVEKFSRGSHVGTNFFFVKTEEVQKKRKTDDGVIPANIF